MRAQQMRANADIDAAAAMSRVTGLAVVDNQYVFVRGLGERYSNTTLAGAIIPTTEPDKKVVPLDMFPAGLLDRVQVAKSYSPDRSAESDEGWLSGSARNRVAIDRSVVRHSAAIPPNLGRIYQGRKRVRVSECSDADARHCG